MKNLLSIILILVPFFSFGQAETKASEKVSTLFEPHYNSDTYQKIFDLFSEKLKARLPLEQTTHTAKRLKNQAGKIKQRQFRRYENEAFNQPKVS